MFLKGWNITNNFKSTSDFSIYIKILCNIVCTCLGWIAVYDFLSYGVLKMLDHMVAEYFNFWRTAKLFSTVAAVPFDILTPSLWGFQFLHILFYTCYFPFIIIIANLLRSEKKHHSRDYQEKLLIFVVLVCILLMTNDHCVFRNTLCFCCICIHVHTHTYI